MPSIAVGQAKPVCKEPNCTNVCQRKTSKKGSGRIVFRGKCWKHRDKNKIKTT